MTDYTRLRRLAENATPGEWTLDRIERTVRATRTPGETILWDDSCHEAENNLADGEFIAAWNPAAALNLLDELRDAKAKLADAWDEGALAGHMEVRSDTEARNPYRDEVPKWRPTADDLGYPDEPAPPLSCRCEFGFAHDCPHHGNKETR